MSARATFYHTSKRLRRLLSSLPTVGRHGSTWDTPTLGRWRSRPIYTASEDLLTEDAEPGTRNRRLLHKRFKQVLGQAWTSVVAISIIIGLVVGIRALFFGQDLENDNDDEGSSVEQILTVRIRTTLGVANVTRGESSYSGSVVASADDVVKFQAWYDNIEELEAPYARDVRLGFSIPHRVESVQRVSVYLTSANGYEVQLPGDVDHVEVEVPAGHRLEYIPDSAKWRHNQSQSDANVNFVTERISDEVAFESVLLDDAAPCIECEATVTILARVVPE